MHRHGDVVRSIRHDSGTRGYSLVQVVGVSTIINHHAYNTRSKENDMSLLKLQQPLVFNQFVRPINIWMSPLPSFRKCTVTGWGSTRESEQLFGRIACPLQSWSRLTYVSSVTSSPDGPRVHRLQEVNVTILPHEVCNQYYPGRVRSTMFCAGRSEGGADACQVERDTEQRSILLL